MTPVNSDIPRTLAPFFQEYVFDQLDATRDADLVIERALAWGNRDELCWVFARYGRARRRVGSKKGSSFLPRRRFNYWCLMLDVIEPRKRSGWASRVWQH